MTTRIEWVVERMECYPQRDGEMNVVFGVHWRCNGADGRYSGTAYGSEGIPLNQGGPLTPYSDLTQDQVIGWVHAVMGHERVAEIEAVVTAQMNTQKAPPVVASLLPWEV